MPIITIEGPVLKEIEKKRNLVEGITRVATETYGMPNESIVIVIRETSPENVGLAGVLIADREK